MIPNQYSQTPEERRVITTDFTPVITEGVTINTYDVEAVTQKGDEDATVTDKARDGNIVSCLVSAPEADHIYDIVFTANLSNGEVVKVHNHLTILAPEEMSHNEYILGLLRDTLQKKLEGRGDIIQYTLGDRQLATMSIDQLTRAITYYEGKVKQYPSRRAV